jgi:hypothetical protein
MSANHDFTRAAGSRDWDAYERELKEAELNGAGLFAVDKEDGTSFITNVRRLAGNTRTPGSRVIAVATWLLFLLGAGLLFVSFSAQFSYVFGIKHQDAPAVIEALSPDLAMVILSALGIGLALAGKASKAERFLIVAFAALAAGMNYAAADATDWRSIAAYMAPPIVLAALTDRVISVIRRHVLPDDTESAWSPFGRALVAAARALVLILLYVLRTILAPRETTKGLRRMVLDAAPVPGMIEAEIVALPEVAPVPEIEQGDETAPELPGFPTKKAAFLSLYRGHQCYGVRDQASPAAAELAPLAGLQPGTGRTYILEELKRLARLTENGK